MLHQGHTFLTHAADSSFPSDHLTLIWATGFALCMASVTRRAGIALAVLGVPVAWSRIYLGVHYPFDMLGAACVAALAALSATHGADCVLRPMLQAALTLYRRVFAPLIVRGWVKS
jgi:undecaprenyl-diphosphatase